MALGVFYFVLYMLVVGMAVGWLAWLVLGKSKALTRDRKPNWVCCSFWDLRVRSSAEPSRIFSAAADSISSSAWG